jgi:hypothetical protein
MADKPIISVLTDAQREIVNRRAQEAMAAIGREGVMGTAGWKYGMNPQDFIRDAIMNAILDAQAVKDPP